jgi:RNA-directed DNA polymerase
MMRLLLIATIAWVLAVLLRRLWKRWSPWLRPLSRDVSRLGHGDAGAVDDAREVIDTSGGALKPHHRRRALRDPRLLPKRPDPNPWAKKHKVMDMAQATRLFAATLRTRNRQIRDLRTDAEQLQRHGLPVWQDEEALAAALDLPPKRLQHYAIHRDKERVSHYVSFAIPKRSGGERLIMAPKRELKAVLRRLNTLLVNQLPVSDAAHGFRTGRSIVSNARPHVGKAVVVRLDIQDFFPSLHMGRVRGLLVALGYGYPVATSLAVLMTESPRQPVRVGDETFLVPAGPRHTVQGAPTSPGLANAIAQKLDHRLQGLARAHGFDYTRYADDLCFSGADVAKAQRLVRQAESIVRSEGFRVNRDKTRVMTQAGAQRVAGVTVNQGLGWSRRQRRRLRAALHQASLPQATGQPAADAALWQRLKGKLAFVRMLNPAQAERLAARLRK